MTATRAHRIEQEVQKRISEEKLQGELRGLEEELLRTKLAAAERRATIESMLAATERVKQERQDKESDIGGARRKQLSVEERVAAEVARQVRLLGLDHDEDNDAPPLSSSSMIMGDRGLLGGSPGLTRPRSEAGSNAPSVITEASPNGTPIFKAKKEVSAAATATAEVISVTAADAGNTPNPTLTSF